MQQKLYATVNMVVSLTMIAFNYYTNVHGLNGYTVGRLSAEYFNYFTPAGYAFSIWGVIFLALLLHAIYQVRVAFREPEKAEFINQIGPWLIIANVGNMAWLVAWLYQYTELSVLVMGVILFALINIMLKLNMQRWQAPASLVRWVWWPMAIYAGWITVAMVANLSAYLAKIGWLALFAEQTWAVIMIGVATAVYLFVLFTRQSTVFVLVGVWAIWAIAVRFWADEASIKWMAVVCGAILLVGVFLRKFKRLQN